MTSGADRQRRYRARKAAGLFRVSISLDQGVVDALVATGHLEEWDEGNRQAIAAAIERLLGTYANDV